MYSHIQLFMLIKRPRRSSVVLKNKYVDISVMNLYAHLKEIHALLWIQLKPLIHQMRW